MQTEKIVTIDKWHEITQNIKQAQESLHSDMRLISTSKNKIQ